MNRIELVDKIAAEHGLTHAASARILKSFVDAIVGAVRKGEPVGIVGFGTFRQVPRAARKGFNPKTGESIRIAARKVPKFIPGSAFKGLVDPRVAARKAAAKKPGRKTAAKRARG